ncbi:MAG: pentapeptide repeat-containing protein [Leptolyngbya sp. SIOISBB]|nr:pentapeptide repeat-containing protein [Leptolyngbya sp. SIOISBB]
MTGSDAQRARQKLIQNLYSLPRAQFEEVIAILNPPAGLLPSSTAPQGVRSTELINWAQGPTGPGLERIQEVLNTLPRSNKAAVNQNTLLRGDILEKLVSTIDSLIIQIRGSFSPIINWTREKRLLVFTGTIFISLIYLTATVTYQNHQTVDEALRAIKTRKGTAEQVEFLVRESKAWYRRIVPNTFQNFLFGDCSLSNLRLESIDLTRRDLQEANFQKSTFDGVKFSGANLQGAKFDQSRLSKVDFLGANLQNASFLLVDFKDTLFDKAELDGADLSYSQLNDTEILPEYLIRTCNWQKAFYFRKDKNITRERVRRIDEFLYTRRLIASHTLPNCKDF